MADNPSFMEYGIIVEIIESLVAASLKKLFLNSIKGFSTVCARLYFKINASTPLSLRYFATSTPSLSIDIIWRAPPGAMMTDVPEVLFFAG